jgi:hypothetical protein
VHPHNVGNDTIPMAPRETPPDATQAIHHHAPSTVIELDSPVQPLLRVRVDGQVVRANHPGPKPRRQPPLHPRPPSDEQQVFVPGEMEKNVVAVKKVGGGCCAGRGGGGVSGRGVFVVVVVTVLVEAVVEYKYKE